VAGTLSRRPDAERGRHSGAAHAALAPGPAQPAVVSRRRRPDRATRGRECRVALGPARAAALLRPAAARTMTLAPAALPPATAGWRLIGESFTAAGCRAMPLLSAVTTFSGIVNFGWRQPMFDQWREYETFLDLPFPQNVIQLNNGHRPMLPNLVRIAEIEWFG